MKTLKFKNLLGAVLLGLFLTPAANAQVWKRIKKSAERTVERKLERKTEKETGKIMDSILDPNEKSPSKKSTSKDSTDNPTSKDKNGSQTSVSGPETGNVSDNLEVYSKYDFVPGDEVLFYDDFSQDFIGDFPSKWNTNASGEVVKINNVEGSWFEMKSGPGIYFIPDVESLPEDFTIEFDLRTQGLHNKTSSTAALNIILSDTDQLKLKTKYAVEASVPFRQNFSKEINVTNHIRTSDGGINSNVFADLRDVVLQQPHVAIAVTKNRFRLWVNETKYLDVPRLITELNVLNHIKFNLSSLTDGVERIFISNLKVAKGGEDLRRKLLSEGKISTNGILFNSGSANIKPQSLGIVLQISQVLLQDENIKLNIVGHTDADGTAANNMKLSKQRAEAVKNALVNLYNISASRLETDGKGASVPIADNTTSEGKAQNRRVEFIKL